MDSIAAGEEIIASIATNLRRLRQDARISIDELAERARVARGTILAIEHARGNPTLATLVVLANAIGVSLSTLLRQEPDLDIRRVDTTVDSQGMTAVHFTPNGTSPTRSSQTVIFHTRLTSTQKLLRPATTGPLGVIILVTEGQVEVRTNNQSLELIGRQAVYCQPAIEYEIHNVSGSTAEIFISSLGEDF